MIMGWKCKLSHFNSLHTVLSEHCEQTQGILFSGQNMGFVQHVDLKVFSSFDDGKIWYQSDLCVNVEYLKPFYF